MKKRGFTLIEIMIVVGVISLLMIALFSLFGKQKSKAEDSRVKTDLELLKIAFENYYNDNNCYPPESWFDDASDCGSPNLQPYIQAIPCDKKTNLPYTLEYVPTQCAGFRLYAQLQNIDDPQVQAISDPVAGSTKGNYGVSSNNTTVKVLVPKNDEPLPPGHSYYYCSPNCTVLEDISKKTCYPYFVDDGTCGNGLGCSTPSVCTYF